MACPIPHYHLPTAAEPERHGMWPLPDRLPSVNLDAAMAYREPLPAGATVVTLESMSLAQIKAVVRLTAMEFAAKEPMVRHMLLRSTVPAELQTTTLQDALGPLGFDASTMQWDRVLVWELFIRLLIFTDPTQPLPTTISEEVLRQSLVMVDNEGQPLATAINQPFHLPRTHAEEVAAWRPGDAGLAAVYQFTQPTFFMWEDQDAAVHEIARRYPAFAQACEEGKVGIVYLLCRGPRVTSAAAFELLVRSIKHYRAMGSRFLVTTAAASWTAAAMQVLGGQVLHYMPYRTVVRMAISDTPLPDTVSSPDGFVSDKDAGAALYIVDLHGTDD